MPLGVLLECWVTVGHPTGHSAEQLHIGMYPSVDGELNHCGQVVVQDLDDLFVLDVPPGYRVLKLF